MKLRFSNDIETKYHNPYKGRVGLEGGSTSSQIRLLQNKTAFTDRTAINNENKTAEVNFGGLLSSSKHVLNFGKKLFTTKYWQENYDGVIKTLKSFVVGKAEKLTVSKSFKSVLAFFEKDQLLADAIFAAIVTCGLRPLFIMSLPSKEEDKEKNLYAAAHSVSSGILGVAFAAVLGSPVAAAVSKVTGKTWRYMDKNKDYVENWMVSANPKMKTAFKEIAKQMPQIGIMPTRAFVTIALVPVILSKVFGISKSKGKKENNNELNVENYISKSKDAKVFGDFVGRKENSVNFTGASAVASKKSAGILTKLMKELSFGGKSMLEGLQNFKDKTSKVYDIYIDKTSEVAAIALGKIAQWDWFRSLCTKVGSIGKKTEKGKWEPDYFKHIIALEGIYLSGFYIYNTMRSKTIAEDQKMPLAVNQGLVTVVSTIGAYTFEKAISKWFESFRDLFKKKNPGMSNADFNKYKGGFSKLKTLVAFGLIYRFITPVFITPIANKISNVIQARKEAKLAHSS